MTRPIIMIPSCTKLIEGSAFDAVGRKYSSAVAEVAECQPLLAPLGPSMADMGALLEIADGILLSGSLSNVHPKLYGLDEPPLNATALDPERDDLTLPLIREALARKLPTFAICRGFQELNVALGGTLDQAVRHGRGTQRSPRALDVPLDDRFGPSHPVTLTGELKSWVGQDEIIVNSLHWQGIKKLAPSLTAKPMRATASSKRCAAPQTIPSFSACSGIPNGRPRTTPCPSSCFAGSARPPRSSTT